MHADPLSALWPVIALIALGALLRRAAFADDAFWRGIERLTYFVLFPALLLHSLTTRPLGGATPGFLLALALPIVLVAVLLVAARAAGWRIAGPAWTSVMQGTTRFNTYAGLTLAWLWLGGSGLALAAVALALLVPLVNIIAVLALTRHGASDAPRPSEFAVLVRNPLVLACAAGLALNAAGVGLPATAGTLLELLGRAALPLGLLAVGAALDLAALRDSQSVAWLAGAIKLLALPALAFGLCVLLGVEGDALRVAVLFLALPTAPSAYVLARQLGGDSRLMAALITGQTLLALLTLPLVLALAG